MARLNARSSYVPSSRFTSATPVPLSDQENQDPMSGMRAHKGKGRASDAPSTARSTLPTPMSDKSDARVKKRKRQATRAGQEDDEGEDDEETDQTDAQKFNQYFDPHQDQAVRRRLKRQARQLERDFNDNRDELLRGPSDALQATLAKANRIYEKVKQTNDATVDSRLLVNISDLAYKKSAQLVAGGANTGVDVDEFLSKCISYMRRGGPPARNHTDDAIASGSRRRQTQAQDPEYDDEDADATLDWESLGRVCFANNSRPPVPCFLLGPLSVEKKARTHTQRRARQAKDSGPAKEARPEALTKEDFTQADENSLTKVCHNIRSRLEKHILEAERNLQRAGFTAEELQTERGKEMLRKHRLADNGAVPLFNFVVNPRSFGQTIENVFYISFLIKEGSVGVEHDEDGLPTLREWPP